MCQIQRFHFCSKEFFDSDSPNMVRFRRCSLGARRICGTCSTRFPVVGVGQVTLMVGSPLGVLFVSAHLKFSKRFYVTWERSKSSFFLEACTARGAAQTRTRGSLICFSESSLQLCQVLNIDISLLDKREL